MQNELVKQWIDSNKLAIESFKNITATNVNAMDAMLTSFVNPSAFAELSKGYRFFGWCYAMDGSYKG